MGWDGPGCGSRRGHWHGGWHGGWGGPHPGEYDGGYGPRGPRWGGRWWRGGLFAVMRRLQLTPDQQGEVREQLEQLAHTLREHRGEWAASRHDVARAMRSESFDAEVMGELFGRHDEHLVDVRKAVMEALGRIHAVLDQTQRERLAELLDREGRWHPFRGGPEGGEG